MHDEGGKQINGEIDLVLEWKYVLVAELSGFHEKRIRERKESKECAEEGKQKLCEWELNASE